MKRFLTFISLLVSIAGFAQTPPRQINAYNAQSQVNMLGIVANDSGLVFRNAFVDTVAANRSWISHVPFGLAIIKDTLRMRNHNADGWITVGASNISLPTLTKTINNKDSIVGAGNIVTNVSGYNEIAQGFSNYDGFPYAIVKADTILYFWKSSATHAGEGKFMIARSVDGNLTIDSVWQVTNTDIDSVLNWSIGITKTGRIVVAVRNTFTTTGAQEYAYSDNGGRTWITAGIYTYNRTSSPFGRIKQVDGDTLLSIHYSAVTTDTTFLTYSADNGATWAFYDTLAFGAGNSYNESDICYLGNRTLIAAVRTENLNRPSQFTSNDNGHTWIRRGGLNALQFTVNGSPVFVEKFNGQLWLLGNFRDGGGDNSVWWYSHGLQSAVFTDTSQWAKRSAYYHPLNDDLGNATTGIDNGYTVPFQYAGKLMVSGYDNTPLQSTTATVKVRSFTIPIVANGDFVSTHNDNANQSIPNNTATLVTYTDFDMNDYLTFNTDSGWVIFQRDGWYNFDAVSTFDLSLGGSYRQLYAFLTAASYNATTSKQPQIISEMTIPGNATNQDFNRLEVHKTYYFRKNEQLKIFVKQDSGGSLNLINTDRNAMSTLVVKRLSD